MLIIVVHPFQTYSLLMYPHLSSYWKFRILHQDVKGPQTVAFNLPNDERIVKDQGTSMVMLKNVSEAKYEISFWNIVMIVIWLNMINLLFSFCRHPFLFYFFIYFFYNGFIFTIASCLFQVQVYSSAYSWSVCYSGATSTCRFWIFLHSHHLPWVLPWDWTSYHNTSKWEKVHC